MGLTDRDQQAQDELFEVQAQLRGILFRLLGVCSTFPASTALREIVECVLADAIQPAIRDLTTAAELLAERDDPPRK